MYVSINQRTLLRRDTLEFAPTPAAVFNSDEEDGDTDEQPEEEEPPAADVWAEAAEEAEEEYVLAWVRSNARRVITWRSKFHVITRCGDGAACVMYRITRATSR